MSNWKQVESKRELIFFREKFVIKVNSVQIISDMIHYVPTNHGPVYNKLIFISTHVASIHRFIVDKA